MKLTEQLTDYIHAACTGLWIHTQEADEAEREILQHARQQQWKVAVWDIASGLRLAGANNTAIPDASDPLAALRALPALAERNGTALLFLHQFHRFLANPEVVQTMFNQLVAGKQQRTFLVVLSPLVQIPVELEKLFVVLEHALPDRQQLEGIARELTSDAPDDLPQGEALQRVLDPAQCHPARQPLGDEGPNAEKKQPADTPSRPRVFRLAGRNGQSQGVLPTCSASGSLRQGTRHPALGRTGLGKELFRQGLG